MQEQSGTEDIVKLLLNANGNFTINADETLALYNTLIQQPDDCQSSQDDQVLACLKHKLAQRIKVGLRLLATLSTFKQARSFIGHELRRTATAKEKAERYMQSQRKKIQALEKERCCDSGPAAAQVVGQQEGGIVIGAQEDGQEHDDPTFEINMDLFQEEPSRDYPRRRPPAPVMPHMGKRRRVKRRASTPKDV